MNTNYAFVWQKMQFELVPPRKIEKKRLSLKNRLFQQQQKAFEKEFGFDGLSSIHRALFALFAICLSMFLNFQIAMVPIFSLFSSSSFSYQLFRGFRVRPVDLGLGTIYHRNFLHSLSPDPNLQYPSRTMPVHRPMAFPELTDKNPHMYLLPNEERKI